MLGGAGTLVLMAVAVLVLVTSSIAPPAAKPTSAQPEPVDPTTTKPQAQPTTHRPRPTFDHADLTGYFDDGIAADEYPPESPWRGSGYPAARVIEDWVWDRVGPNWAVVLYNADGDEGPDVIPTLYLVSPEGVHFLLDDVDELSRNNPGVAAARRQTVVALWREAAGEVVLSSSSREFDQIAAAVVDVRADEAKIPEAAPGSLPDDGCATARAMRPIAGGAAGRELWGVAPCGRTGGGVDDSGNYWWGEFDTYVVWDPHTGWVKPPGALQGVVMERWHGARSVSGSSVAIERSLSDWPRVLVYDLDSNTTTTVDPPAADKMHVFGWFEGWVAPGVLGYGTDNWGPEPPACFDVPVAPARQVEAREQCPYVGEAYAQGRDWHPNGWPITLVSDRQDKRVYEVDMTVGGKNVVVASQTDGLLRSGHEVTGLTELAPGVYRVTLSGGVIINLDTVTGESVVMVSARDSHGGVGLADTYVLYGEASSVP